MRILSFTFLATLTLLAGSVIYLGTKRDDEAYQVRMRRESDAFLLLVPNVEDRDRILARARAAGREAERLTDRMPVSGIFPVATAARSAAVRASLGLAILPLFASSLLAGSIVGLLRRERVREEFVFASVTASYLAKLLVAGSTAGYLFTSLSPAGPAIWALYLFTATATVGVAVWFGNLPPKL